MVVQDVAHQSDAIGVAPENLPAVMTIAQFAEIFVMAFLLSWSLKRYGMRRTLAIGVVRLGLSSSSRSRS